MAHRSRLSTILIDVPTGEAPAAAAFWSGALGVPATAVPGEEQFIALHGALPELVVSLQAVDDPRIGMLPVMQHAELIEQEQHVAICDGGDALAALGPAGHGASRWRASSAAP